MNGQEMKTSPSNGRVGGWIGPGVGGVGRSRDSSEEGKAEFGTWWDAG